MRRALVAVVAAAMLSSCASIPLSAIARGASFNEGNLGFLDARALRVKVALPEGFVLDVERTRLKASILSSSSSREAEYALQLLETMSERRGGGYFSKEMAATSYEMNLTDVSARSLRELQGSVASGKVKSFQLDVQVRLKQVPAGATSAKAWVDLLVSPMEGYFPLVDGGTVPVGM